MDVGKVTWDIGHIPQVMHETDLFAGLFLDF
jgi:hypothetical protein